MTTSADALLDDTAPPNPMALLFGPGGADDPHPAYRELRERCPVARTEIEGVSSVYLSRYQDVLWAMRHPEVFSSDVEALSIGQEQPLIPLQVDPPDHTRYRRLLNPEFLPRTIARIEPDVRALVGELVDAFAGRGECDIHEELATPLPSTIFLRLMGLPQSDLSTFLGWRDDIIRPDVEPGDFEAAARVREEAGRGISAYFREKLAAKRARPDAELLSRLVTAEIDGERLTERELLGTCHLLLLGGLDTVTATLDCMVVHLARHPEQRRQLVEDPSLIPSAVEELLRHQTPVMVVLRIVARDVTIGDVDLRAGDHVTLVLGSANTDAGAFTNPEVAQLDRAANKHLAFGGGNHLCLGAHLARAELRIGLEELHRRIPDYELAPGADITFSPGIRQAEHLPIVFHV